MIGVRLMVAASVLGAAVGPPVHAAPPVEAYGKLPGISDVELSPSGDRIAFISTDGDSHTLVAVSPDGKLLASVTIGALTPSWVTWGGEDHVLAAVPATFKQTFRNAVAEAEQAFSLDVPAGKAISIFGERHGQRMLNGIWGYYGSATLNGHSFGWFGGITFNKDKNDTYLDHGWPDLYKVDLTSGDVEKVADGRQDIGGWLVSPAGAIVAESRYSQAGGSWAILAGRSVDQTIASGQADFGGAGGLEFGQTPDRLLVATPTGEGREDRDGYTFRDLALDGGSENAIVDEEKIASPLIDPTSRLWIGNMLMNDEREPVLFSPPFAARWRGARKAFPVNFAHLASWSADFTKLIVYTDGGDDSGTYWFVDIASHKALPVGSAYEAVKPEDVGRVRMVQWRAADGLALSGVLTLPPNRPAKSLPLIVLPHGGPQGRDYPGFEWWAQAYASRGYAVFQPNFRGSGGYGVGLRNAGLGQWGRKMQTDVSDGVAELARQGIVDAKRACIVGGSYGGYVALAGVTIQHGLYRCAVSVAGVADLAEMLAYNRDTQGLRSGAMRYWKAYLGVSGSTDGSLAEISPVLHASSADAPIMLIHGDQDVRVPINQSQRMEAALKSAGKPVELVVMDGEDHMLSHENNRIQMLKASVAFVEKYNPPN